MPKLLPFVLLKRFESSDEFNAFRDKIYDYSISNTKWATCNSCDIENHMMKIQYAECTNAPCKAAGGCMAKYKIHSCDNDQIEIYEFGEHSAELLKSEKSVRGISDKAKTAIESIINVSLSNNIECKPKRIHYKLQMAKYKNAIDSVPSLKKIQTYMSNHKFRERFKLMKRSEPEQTNQDPKVNNTSSTSADLINEESVRQQTSIDAFASEYFEYGPIKVEIFADDDN
jgi:hypothetical protein